MEAPVLFNPFLENNRLHFPSFIEAFGDLLKIEEENIRKISLQKSQHNSENIPPNSSSSTNHPSKSKPSSLQSNHTNPTTKNTPLTSININQNNTNQNQMLTNKSLIYKHDASTPIPTTKKSKKFKFTDSNHKTKSNTNSLTIPSNNPINTTNTNHCLSSLQITPIPSRNCKKITFTNSNKNTTNPIHKSSTNSIVITSSNGINYDVVTPIPSRQKTKTKSVINHKQSQPLDIIVTPAPKKSKSFKNISAEQSILMLKDIMSPMPANRYELNSPAPNDKNARILTRTPAKFPIIMPPTPMLHGDRKRIALEEQKNNEFFMNHKPILTPVKLRENPVKLYNPLTDANASQLLLNMTVPFESQHDTTMNAVEVNAKAMQPLECDLSMIAPSKNINKINSICGFSNIFNDTITSDPFTPVMVKDNDGYKSKSVIDSIDEQFSAIKLNKSVNKSLNLNSFEKSDHSLGEKDSFSGDKSKDKINSFDAHKTMGFGDDSFLAIDPMSDQEFFSRTGVEDQCTQTSPVLIFNENDIPKITYNGKLINDNIGMSMSAICYNDKYNELNMSNISIKSSKSENNRILYNNNMYTPVLRYNRDSITCDSDIINNEYCDSDNGMDKSIVYKNRNNTRNKKKESGDRLLRKYKQSKLAQNPNWSLAGDLI